MYDYPKCSQNVDGIPCKLQPINKCEKCGGLICIEHSNIYRSPNSGADYAVFNGIYCDKCYNFISQKHDEKVERDNAKIKGNQIASGACDCMNCGCQTLSGICSSV